MFHVKHLKILLLVMALLWLLLSFLVGGQAARIHAQLDGALRTPLPIKLEPLRFQRGLFSSQADSRLVLNLPQLPNASSLALEHRIVHGPFAFSAHWQGRFALAPAQAIIETRITADSALLEHLEVMGQGLTQLIAILWITLDGQTYLQTYLPSSLNLQDQQQTLSVTELQLDAVLNAEGRLQSFEGRLADFQWCQGTGNTCLWLDMQLSGQPSTGWSVRGDLEVTPELLLTPLIEGFLARRQLTRRTATPGDLRVANNQARQQLQLLINAGIFQRRAGPERLVLTVSWEQGALRLNQQLRSWPQLAPVLSVLGAQLLGEI